MRKIRAIVAVGTPVLMAAQGVLAQQVPPGAQRVDPGVGDVGALPGVSRADLYRELRQERGFGTVYRLDARPPMGAPGTGSTMYMRVDGGITAVFPESVYYNTPGGMETGVPPGTTFYIGRLPESFGSAPAPPPRAPNYVNTRVELHADARPAPVLPLQQPQAEPPTIWEDEAYRQRLIARLMRRAAEGSR